MESIGSDNLESKDFLKTSGIFFLVIVGGVLIGILGAAFTVIATRYDIFSYHIFLKNKVTIVMFYCSYIIYCSFFTIYTTRI